MRERQRQQSRAREQERAKVRQRERKRKQNKGNKIKTQVKWLRRSCTIHIPSISVCSVGSIEIETRLFYKFMIWMVYNILYLCIIFKCILYLNGWNLIYCINFFFCVLIFIFHQKLCQLLSWLKRADKQMYRKNKILMLILQRKRCRFPSDYYYYYYSVGVSKHYFLFEYFLPYITYWLVHFFLLLLLCIMYYEN